MLAEPRKVANADDDIETLWNKTRKVIVDELGEDDENLAELDEQFESFDNDEEAEDFYEEEVIDIMNEIGPDNLEFGMNNDGEIGYWYPEDILDQEDEEKENAWNELSELVEEDEKKENEHHAEVLDKDDNVVAKAEYSKNPDRDNIITVCMKCNKILGGTNKKDVSDLTDEEKDLVSHGLCDACLEKYYPEKKDEQTKTI